MTRLIFQTVFASHCQRLIVERNNGDTSCSARLLTKSVAFAMLPK